MKPTVHHISIRCGVHHVGVTRPPIPAAADNCPLAWPPRRPGEWGDRGPCLLGLASAAPQPGPRAWQPGFQPAREGGGAPSPYAHSPPATTGGPCRALVRPCTAGGRPVQACGQWLQCALTGAGQGADGRSTWADRLNYLIKSGRKPCYHWVFCYDLYSNLQRHRRDALVLTRVRVWLFSPGWRIWPSRTGTWPAPAPNC